ncbi:Hint domain-containing protein [Asaia sp. BMEF1]|uniref:Hint domain-containing protein n=1 Tax=Asaia sp. BMEF1 TaxID=3155932 RepID=UPI003F668856
MALIDWSQTGGAYTLKNVDVLDVRPAPTQAKDDVFTRVDISGGGGWIRITVPTPSATKDLTFVFFVNPGDSNGTDAPILGYEFVGQTTTPTTVSTGYNSATGLTTVEVSARSSKGFTTTYRILYIGNPFNLPANGKTEVRNLTYGEKISYKGIICFLAGSEIRTPQGAVTIESLRVGDEVCVWDVADQREEIRPVTWIGKGFASVIPSIPDDEAGWPICICKDAISDGIPSQDLHVTGEHSIFFDNLLVPARMLVNGRSIYFDKRVKEYEFYHIETQQHSIIWANDLKTESYLDTGNRHGFTSQSGGVVVPIRPLNWSSDAVVRLVTDRAVVEPLHAVLARRSERLIKENVQQSNYLTADPELCLETDAGLIIWPSRKREDYAIFSIPSGVTSLVIHSRVSRPCDVFGPYVDDRRRLGVLIGRITLFSPTETTQITTHLSEKFLSGWHEGESQQARWTTGSAALPLDRQDCSGNASLALQIVAGGPYIRQRAHSQNLTITAGQMAEKKTVDPSVVTGCALP